MAKPKTYADRDRARCRYQARKSRLKPTRCVPARSRGSKRRTRKVDARKPAARTGMKPAIARGKLGAARAHASAALQPAIPGRSVGIKAIASIASRVGADLRAAFAGSVIS